MLIFNCTKNAVPQAMERKGILRDFQIFRYDFRFLRQNASSGALDLETGGSWSSAELNNDIGVVSKYCQWKICIKIMVIAIIIE